MKKLFFTFIMLLAMTMVAIGQMSANQGELTIKLKGFRNDKGQVCISLFDGPKGFPGRYDQACRIIRCAVRGNQVEAEFSNLPFGTYAVSVLHDENANNKMDTSIIGIPKEGYGASNNPKKLMGPPTFKDAMFEFKKHYMTLEINIKYF